MTGEGGVGGSAASIGRNSPAWMADAICTSVGEDWVESSDPAYGECCTRCPVRRNCAEYALGFIDDGDRLTGWWGGFYLREPWKKEARASDRRADVERLRQLAG